MDEPNHRIDGDPSVYVQRRIRLRTKSLRDRGHAAKTAGCRVADSKDNRALKPLQRLSCQADGRRP